MGRSGSPQLPGVDCAATPPPVKSVAGQEMRGRTRCESDSWDPACKRNLVRLVVRVPDGYFLIFCCY